MQFHPGLRLIAIAIAAITALVAVPAAAQAAKKPNKVNVKVMTRNIYLGADLTPVMTAPTPLDVPVRAGIVWRQLRHTNFPGRAALLADEIGRHNPDVVGLQEVAHWKIDRSADGGGPPVPGLNEAKENVYNFLQLLRTELAARGLKYRVASFQNNFAAELPVDISQPPDVAPEFDARLQMRDVILVRRNLKVRASTAGRFAQENTLQIPIAGAPAPLPVYRGWTSVTVAKRKLPFRVVNTHLEAFGDGTHRLGQAQELAAHRDTNHKRLVLVGDLNSDPDGGSPEAYNVFTTDEYGEGGYRDRGVSVDTCCHDDDLSDGGSTFSSRIDHILTKGKVRPGPNPRQWLTGAETDVFDQLGVWPSDHGGVVSKFIVRR